MAGDLARAGAAHIEPADRDLARRGTEQPRDELGERGLARAVLPHHGDELAGTDVEVDGAHGDATAPVAVRDVPEGEHGLPRDGRAWRLAGATPGSTHGRGGAGGGARKHLEQARDGLVHREEALLGGKRARLGEAVGDARHAGTVDARLAQGTPSREDGARRAVEDDVAAVEDDHAVRELGEKSGLLLDDDDRDAGGVEVAQGLEDHARGRGVQGRRRLVEHEHLGAQRQDRGDGDLLLLPARERGDVTRAKVCDAAGAEGPGEARLDLVARDAEVLEPEEELVLDARGDHLGVDVLQDRPHDARDVGEADLAGVHAVDGGGAAEGAGKVVRRGTRDDRAERGLASTRRADHADEGAGRHGEADVAQGERGLALVAEADVVERDDGPHLGACLAEGLGPGVDEGHHGGLALGTSALLGHARGKRNGHGHDSFLRCASA